jgi:hypothetical protein
MNVLGAPLIKLATDARQEFVMCAPFAKEAVVSRVVAAVPSGVRIVLFTRWRPDEVAAGVSDTEVLAVIRSRGGVVYLHDRLHAKFYRNERCSLIGSANLTATALGWAQQPNLELLVASDDSQIDSLERTLIEDSMVATDEIAREVEEIAGLLPTTPYIERIDEEPNPVMWIPALRMPSDLFTAYSGGAKGLAARSAEAAAADLWVLDVPSGLARDQFELLIGDRLRHQPLFAQIDKFLTEPRRFGEMRDFLSRIAGLDRPQAEESWQAIVRWMLEFLPKRYLHNTFRHTEVVSLAQSEARSE